MLQLVMGVSSQALYLLDLQAKRVTFAHGAMDLMVRDILVPLEVSRVGDNAYKLSKDLLDADLDLSVDEWNKIEALWVARKDPPRPLGKSILPIGFTNFKKINLVAMGRGVLLFSLLNLGCFLFWRVVSFWMGMLSTLQMTIPRFCL
jgi:hypothetical protein